MGKKRKYNEDSEDDEDNNEIQPQSKKKKTNYNSDDEDESQHKEEYTNGFHNSPKNKNDEAGRYEVYLIKKPIKMSIEELNLIKWSFDETILAKTKIKTESGNYRAIIAENKKQKMVHIPAIREIVVEDSKNLAASSFVDGIVNILPSEIKQKHLGGSIFEEGDEEADIPQAVHPNLKPIKKTAVLDLDSRKERNRAYGTKTDSNGEPRIIIDTLNS